MNWFHESAGVWAAAVLGVVLLVSLAVQIAKRRATERTGRQARVQFETLLNSLGDGVLIVDKDSRMLVHNAASEQMLGAMPAGISAAERARRITVSYPDRVTPYPPDQLPLARAIRGESSQGIEVFTRNPDTGVGRILNLTATPMRGPDGTIEGGVAVFRDISEKKRTREELERSNAELEQFAYVASHDLQEPLRMVASYTQLLKKRYGGKLDADADEFIQFAVDGANRMQQLIQDLLAYSRVGSSHREPSTVSLEQVFDRATANLRAAIDSSGATVTHDPLPEVLGDETQLTQVFQNLIGNALKYRGTAPPRIHVGVKRDDAGDYVLSVQDNGIGIAKEYFDRIFLLFQRLHGREDYPGTGIGLTITRKIVERHGGRIWLTSTPGEGTCFFFSLPSERTAWHPTA